MKSKALVLITLFALLGAASLSAGNPQKQDSLKYRIYLTDKNATSFSLQHPEAYLSQKALDRRSRQHLSIDSTDLPVCSSYVKAIAKVGVKIVAVGKWNNFVTVSCNDIRKIEKIEKLNFVRSTELVWRIPKTPSDYTGKRMELIKKTEKSYVNTYGTAYNQAHLCNIEKLHQAGYKGKGMTIAIIDAGFHNADSIPNMSNIHILGTHDFITSGGDVFSRGTHGMCVLSIMGMNQPNYMVGTAPEASYWLLRSEDEDSENLVEQDYWSEAIEFADSVGVDVVNSSLGYYNFDDTTKDMTYCQLDGKHALVSRQASMAADKGMLVVLSAGNTGSGSWKKITVPGDADNVLTVGAVTDKGVLATFSSIGNTADGRIKPDVVAVGFHSAIMNAHGNLAYGNGTSFSSPTMCGMVTCLWQACPEFTAKQIMDAVRRAGDRAVCPDNIYGYGIPDMWKALVSLKPNIGK